MRDLRLHKRVRVRGVRASFVGPDGSVRYQGVVDCTERGMCMDGVELRPGWAFDFVLHGSGMHGIGHGRVVYGERDRSGVLVDRWVGVPKLVSPITRAATASGFVSDWAY